MGMLPPHGCFHYFARRREGRRCIHCHRLEVGSTIPVLDENGVMLAMEKTQLCPECGEEMKSEPDATQTYPPRPAIRTRYLGCINQNCRAYHRGLKAEGNVLVE